MPTFALLYDVHGNLPALQAVLQDARGQEVDAFLLGGDYALFGPWPAETVAALAELPDAIWIRGNVDRWTAFPDEAGDDDVLQGAIADCRRALGEDVTARLGSLPEETVIGATRYCHASPLSDLESFLPEPRDEDEGMLAGVRERRVVFGHTHLQFRRIRGDGIELLNPGSVGLPLDGDDRAAYGVARPDGTVDLRRVEYDYEASAQACRERFGDAPWAVRSESRILRAAF